MNIARRLRTLTEEMMAAFQFLTRIPMPLMKLETGALARAVKFFPFVGLVVGSGAVLLQKILLNHLPRSLVALLVLTYLVLITGGLQEDALADAADGFGGGWNKEQILVILKDSRIGSYGGVALILSLLMRYLLLVSLPLEHFAAYLISAHVLCRWSSLPLSYFLAAARGDNNGQGARIARLTSLPSLLFGTVFTFAVVIFALRWSAAGPLLAASLAVVLSGYFYWIKIGGVTGDCFGSTNQLAEISVYLCGAWNR